MGDFRDYTLERLGRVEKIPSYPSLNEAVLLFNRFRIYEIVSALLAVVLFGVIRSDWLLCLFFVALMLVGSPALRKRTPPSFLYRKGLDRFSKCPCGPFTWGRSHGPF